MPRYHISIVDTSNVKCSKEELFEHLMSASGFDKVPDEGEEWKEPEESEIPDWGYVKKLVDIEMKVQDKEIVKSFLKILKEKYPNENISYSTSYEKTFEGPNGQSITGLVAEVRPYIDEKTFDNPQPIDFNPFGDKNVKHYVSKC